MGVTQLLDQLPWFIMSQSHMLDLSQSVICQNYTTVNRAEALSVVENCISSEMNERLIKDVSVEEIKKAAFDLGSLKAPGPDGYPSFFFQSYWEKVGEGVCQAVQRFFNNGFLLKELNQTNIVLIPKVSFPETLGQYRPISLCNFAMKVITKVMANRLKGILQHIISPNQSAFVIGRQIQDNVIVAHEAFHFLKMKKKGCDGFLALKLDFNKAYDRVEWDFVEALLLKMGFHERWVKTVRRVFEGLKESREARVPLMIHMDNLADADNSQWRAPNQGRIKINCDVAIRKNGQEAACAAVVRNWVGKLIDGHVISAKVTSSLQGELLAIRLACAMANSLGLLEVEIESDNQMAIKLSASELVPPWEVGAVVQDIRLLSQSGGFSFKWVKREANGLAHLVASYSLRSLLPRNWVASPPAFVDSILMSECLSPL
ncbi:hypothetical protein RHSIM_Rhsim07G0138700 [Rhododendron simsii]|uniref:Reverse transcriptase domain-containing protein n=1 Tax=Rhododendron simsii TaxID=118357 RepID=A0A834LK01_RHOSS|nr:hypothetical protein RHSIM_Rhsim07G0138700 [Rhododendron simsii]